MTKRLAILIVDDHPVNRKITLKAVEGIGFEAHASASGPDALVRLAERSFAAVLMDRYMPDCDGPETTRRLIERWGAKAPPVIGLSAGGPDDEAACRSAGMVDFLQKPATPRTLKFCLQRWLHQAPNDGTQTSGDAPENSRKLALPRGKKAPPSESLGVFDATEALAMVGGDTTLLSQVVDVYLSVASNYLARLRSAVLAADSQAASESAHAIKSAARSLSAHELAQLTDFMELQVHALSPAECSELLERIEKAALRLESRLESYNRDSNSSSAASSV